VAKLSVGAKAAAAFSYRCDIGASYGTHLVLVDRICHRLGWSTLGFLPLLFAHSCFA
jgi:hypothetical protein